MFIEIRVINLKCWSVITNQPTELKQRLLHVSLSMIAYFRNLSQNFNFKTDVMGTQILFQFLLLLFSFFLNFNYKLLFFYFFVFFFLLLQGFYLVIFAEKDKSTQSETFEVEEKAKNQIKETNVQNYVLIYTKTKIKEKIKTKTNCVYDVISQKCGFMN